MRHPRQLVSLVCGSIFALWVGSLALQQLAKRSHIRDLHPERYYAVDLSFDHAVCDLAFSTDTRYLLVIGSLGNAEKQYHISLRAEPVHSVSKLPVNPISIPANTLPEGQQFASTRKEVDQSNGHDGRVPHTQVRRMPHQPPEAALEELDRIVVQASRLPKQPRRRHHVERRIVPVQSTDRDASTTDPKQMGVAGRRSSRSQTRNFHVHVTDGDLNDPRQYARIGSRVIAEGPDVRIFLDQQQRINELTNGLPQQIVDYLETDIMPRTRHWLGDYWDVDQDGKLAILLTPWLGRLQGGRTSVGGFVRASDFRRDLSVPFSNQSDVLFLNSNVRPGPHLRDLLAHEYTHAVCFSQRLRGASQPGLPDEEDWMNEALAHLAENSGRNIDHRISRFLNATANYPLVVDDYYRAGLWRNHGCRGATYLFLKWCVDHFDDNLPRRLVQGSARGVRNLEMVTGQSFADLFRLWSIALVESGRHRGHDRGTSSNSPSYRSLSLYGTSRNQGLSGPQRDSWDVSRRSHTVILKGTAVAFLDLHSSLGRATCRRLHLQGELGSKLQVSLLKMSHQWPRATIEAQWRLTTPDDDSAADNRQPGAVVDVCVRAGRSPGIRVEMINCDRRGGREDDVAESYCWTATELRHCSRGFTAHFAAPDASPATDENRQTFSLPLPSRFPRGESLIVKALVRDAAGRRTAAWTILDPQAWQRKSVEVATLRLRDH